MCMPVLWRLVTPCLTQWFWSHSGRSITLWLVVVCLSKLEHIGTVLQWIIILHWFQCRCFPGVAEAVFAGAVAVMEPEGPMVNMFCNYSMKFSLYLVAMHKRESFSMIALLKSHMSLMTGVYGCLCIVPSKDHGQNQYTIYYTSIFLLNAELRLAVILRSIMRPLL
jgi:hypothetical protein